MCRLCGLLFVSAFGMQLTGSELELLKFGSSADIPKATCRHLDKHTPRHIRLTAFAAELSLDTVCRRNCTYLPFTFCKSCDKAANS